MEENPTTEQPRVKILKKASPEPGPTPAHAPAPAQGKPLPQRVYIGPNKPFGLPLMQFSIVRGAPAAAYPKLSEHMAAHPDLSKLFVAVPELAKARAELKTNGSPLFLAFAALARASAAYKQ